MKTLELPHLPDMLFLHNHLTLNHQEGLHLSFKPLDALKRVNAHEDLVHVSMSQVVFDKMNMPTSFYIFEIKNVPFSLFWILMILKFRVSLHFQS